MQEPEFERLFELCYEWTNRDAATFVDRSLKDNAPDNVKKAFKKLKKLQKEYDDSNIVI